MLLIICIVAENINLCWIRDMNISNELIIYDEKFNLILNVVYSLSMSV